MILEGKNVSYACISDVCAVEPRRRFVVTKRKKKKKRKRKPKFKPRLLCLGNYLKSTQWLFGFKAGFHMIANDRRRSRIADDRGS